MTTGQARVLVWDWTVRLFHWLTVLLVASMWWTAEEGMMDWHRRIGMILVGLISYRIVWGLIGPPTARFARMVPTPQAALAYLGDLRAGRHKVSLGHNPVGVLSVFAMLLALTVQVSTGLFSVDVDGIESGPLSRHVSFETGRLFAEIHETSFNILLALIVLHVLAIATYLVFFKDNLVRPMVTGRRASTDFDASVADNRAGLIRVVIALAAAFAAMSAIWFAGG
ncbi:MAG: cytochrome b/b6 domain-containing protein [Hyphomonas sp.]|uniref:cytochrome b/b6 domain-containing protein n=1 Tax=Hyphomonas sp. TaxID=87 RepID=UPI003526C4B1